MPELRVGQREAQEADDEAIDQEQRRDVAAGQQLEEPAEAVDQHAQAQRGEDGAERHLQEGCPRVTDPRIVSSEQQEYRQDQEAGLGRPLLRP